MWPRYPLIQTLLLLSTLAPGCAGPPPPAAPPRPDALPLPDAPGVPWLDFPATRAVLEDQRRDAIEAPEGTTRLDFSPGENHTVLRFSLLPAQGARVRATIHQDGHTIALEDATDAARWSVRTAPIAPGEPLSLVLQCDGPFHIAACATLPAAPQQPDIVVVLIDTLRKDHLGCYHYPLDTSPAIDAFAAEATLFREAVPMSSWTRPSIASLLTGTLDATHHALSPEDHLRDALPSLPGTFAAAGWETHAIVTNPAIGGAFGFDRHFQWYEDVWVGRQPVNWKADLVAVDRAIEAIEHAHGQPLFLYLHTMAPHRDYDPPAEYEAMFMPDRFVGTREQVRIAKDLARYDAEIRFSDDQFARVVQALKNAGRYDNALIVVTSDHGEQFMEHGELAHAMSLHFAELGVPLIVKLPGNAGAGRVARHQVSVNDLAPTLLHALGLPVPAEMEARSLLPLITFEGVFPPRPAFARLRIGERHYHMAKEPGLKYLHDVVLGESTWYNLDEDPLELRPLRQAPEGGDTLKAFADEIAARPIPAKGATSPALSDEQRQQLEALGYF